MRTFTFHPNGVRDVSERLGAFTKHVITGPRGPVLRHVYRLEAGDSSLRFSGAYERGGTLEVVVYRGGAPTVSTSGTPVALGEPLHECVT